MVAAIGTLICVALFMKRVRRLSGGIFAVDEPETPRRQANGKIGELATD